MMNMEELIKALEGRQRRMESLRETTVTQDDRIILPGPFLHQDTKNMSEKESAEFERDNKLLFDTLRMIREKAKIKR